MVSLPATAPPQATVSPRASALAIRRATAVGPSRPHPTGPGHGAGYGTTPGNGPADGNGHGPGPVDGAGGGEETRRGMRRRIRGAQMPETDLTAGLGPSEEGPADGPRSEQLDRQRDSLRAFQQAVEQGTRDGRTVEEGEQP